MNSVEGYKGLLTFLILSGVVLTALIGFDYISKVTNTLSTASEDQIIPLDTTIKDITSNSATVTWSTIEPIKGTIVYGTQKDLCTSSNNSSCNEINEATQNTTHTIILANLLPNTSYYLGIKIGAKYYPLDKPLKFKTKPATTKQNNAPSHIEGKSDFRSKILNNTSDSEGITPINNNNGDYSGIQLTPTFQSLSTPQQDTENSSVLGLQANRIDENLTEEFNKAMLRNDLNYDFDQNGEIDLLDYPYFIEFVKNEGD